MDDILRSNLGSLHDVAGKHLSNLRMDHIYLVTFEVLECY